MHATKLKPEADHGNPQEQDPRPAGEVNVRRAEAEATQTPARAARGPRWREQVRSKPGLSHAYRAAVFVAGLVCIAGGIGLAALPGPLTIPPVLLGLWLWSTEFRFADRILDSFKAKGAAAWAHAKRRPISSALLTIGGLAAAAAAFWAVGHFELIDKARSALGL